LGGGWETRADTVKREPKKNARSGTETSRGCQTFEKQEV